ncbi:MULTISPECIES: T7SS effector LXG polymorphic toxin [Bacillus]|uniref:T7SS effector LXG polymorphic toxin n=1 Tax=Bacillus TaxID=1386 RepID=UPI000BF37EEC|nr:T7SS effector LXG polymorphic toxin [Bacillus safensis]MCY7479103.1 T7SS effector LXG polymorphic toxin [Bacillus safensis]MCY7512676.1 T7SS effector LXG polymorphic toxin [Bacillus safensis]MCY7541903.1 T7SS effector LXG polymorphic toxin [Bacillus safensis]MCY7549691.1 T7SS effector LXG polymorphic toxin [Bacillus safensis]MCY7644988.1 T7SS effector LXG polymorphic toxin [Bacillus safensis]
MKTLDAFALINGIDQTLNALKQQSQQISSLEKQINHIISLDGALKGEAGQAIRAFYTECHIPFLQFFQVVIEEYSAALKNTKQALSALESNEHGYISQAFIEHDLDQGLKKAEQTISEIVSEVNHAIGRVGHIVHLPNVDESVFQQNYQKAWLETSKTIGLLHAFDREQTSALHETKSSLQTMKQYIDTLSTMFTGPKIDITSYQKGSIFKDGKEEKVSSTISGLKNKIDNPKDNPLMIMLKKLKEKQQANVETVVRNDNHKNISKQVTANDPSLTTLQKEAVNGKNKIHRDIRVINGRLYNVKDIKKLKEFDIADEVVTDPSDIDFIGGRYTVYANKQIIRTYIANGEIRIEEVDKIPESRSRGNAKRILDGEVVSTTENIILEYSGIYDGYRAVTGKDPETSQNISSTDQALSAASIIPITKIVKVGKYVFRLDQGKNVKRVEKTAKGAGDLIKFKGDQAIIHYEKHSKEIMDAMGKNQYNIKNYLKDANHVIQKGKYVPELNGYVRLVGGKGSAKYGFVGLDRKTGNITTFHIKSVKELSKKAPSLGIKTKK